jgi:hypothetical protein
MTMRGPRPSAGYDPRMRARTENQIAPSEGRGVRTAIAAGAVAFSAIVFWYTLRSDPPHLPPLGLRAEYLGFNVEKARVCAAALLFMAALNLAAWQLGAGIRRALGDTRRGPGSLAGLAQLAYGLLAIPYLVLALAASHLLYPIALAAVLAVPCATLLPRIHHRLVSIRASAREAFLACPAAHRWTWLAFACVLVAGPLLSALSPEVGWDADVYHLAIPERMLAVNGIWFSPFSMFTAFPAHMEMFYVLALGLSGDVAAKLIHFELGVLTCILVYRVGALESTRCALLALLFMISEPLLYSEMAWAYSDLIAPFYALFAFVSLRDWLRTRDRALLLRAGLFSGACLATRYLGGAVLLGLCAALWLAPRRESLSTRLRGTLALAGLSGLALLPWLVRNLIFTGNPIAPVAQAIFHAPGAEYFPPLAIRQTYAFHDGVGMGRDLQALLKLPWNLSVVSTPGVYSGSFGYRLSPLHAIGFASALAVTLLRRRLDMARGLVVIATLVLLWFPLFQEPRFLLPAIGILALLAGWAFDELLPPVRRLAASSALWIPLIAALSLAWLPQFDALGVRYGVALGPLWAGDPRAEDAIAALRAAVASRPGARIFVVGMSRSYAFRGLDIVPYQALEAPPTLAWLHESPDVESLHCRLRAMQVSHVFADFQTLSSVSRPIPLADYGAAEYRADVQKVAGLIDERARPIYSKGGIRIAELAALKPGENCPPMGLR